MRPFWGAQAESIKAAVEAARAAGDHEIYYVDTGSYPGPTHPPAKDCTELAAKLIQILKSEVLDTKP